MALGHSPPTATILPFPDRGRTPGRTGLGLKSAGKPDDAGKAMPTAPASFADGWYHQAAIDEASHIRKP